MRHLALLVLVGVTSACAGRSVYPVQPVSPRWTMPPKYAACQARGDRVFIDGRWHVVAECLDGLRMFDLKTKKETEFVSWAEIGK